MKLLSPASKNSSAPREPTEEVKNMRMVLIRVMMLIMWMMLLRVMVLIMTHDEVDADQSDDADGKELLF